MTSAATSFSPISPNLLGQRLLQEGIITKLQLARALKIQKKSGGRIGEILYSLGACNSLALHQQLARQHSLPFADLINHPPWPGLADEKHLADYLHLQAIPWQQNAKGEVIIACLQVTPKMREWAAKHYPLHSFALTSRLDFNRCLSMLFSDALSHLSKETLWKISPHHSARHTLMRRQRWALLIFASLISCSFWIAPAASFVAFCLIINCFYLATLGFKMVLFVQGRKHRERLWKNADIAPISDSDLPVYTVLIPLYREAEGLPHILNALRRIDYPPSKLDIKLVLEGDDIQTIAAAKAQQPEGMFEILIVPPSEPRTKPKACNYALRFARGEYVTIYDAEDRPDPQQLRQVIQRFRQASKDVICVQCRLNYYNRSHNLLTRLFAIEYASWFDYMLPGLETLDLPLPLGGTSNHIALAKLRELGEWDPYNVTEDADLGIRMAGYRYRTLTLHSLTLEEAPTTLWAWIKQRSRWIKGYMQTWLVYMRQPVSLYKQLGLKKFLGFQFFIGGPCLVFLTTPLMIVLSALWLLKDFTVIHPMLPLLTPLAMTVLGCGVVLHLAFGRQVLRDNPHWQGMKLAVLIFPLYWLLHSLASFRGLWQLITRPHYWDKTSHTHLGNP